MTFPYPSLFAQLKRPSSEEKLQHDYQMTMSKLSKRQFISMEWHAESSSEDCVSAYKGLGRLSIEAYKHIDEVIHILNSLLRYKPRVTRNK